MKVTRTRETYLRKNISMNVLCSWSGGKDSCYALMKAVEAGHTPCALLNMMNEEGATSRSHRIPKAILEAQAAAAQIPIHLEPASWKDYQPKFIAAISSLKVQYALDAVVFGDIDLQEHRDWEEAQCSKVGLEAMLPLWKLDREALVLEMLRESVRAMIISCNETMGESFLGRFLDNDTIADLKDIGVDVCGENGEFHTVVIDCPLFERPVSLGPGKKIKEGGFWFLEPELL